MSDSVALKDMTKASATFKIGDRDFIMKPLVVRKVRELIQFVEDSGAEMEDFKTLKGLDMFFVKRITKLFLILFDQSITQEFADENISLPLCREIWETTLKLNRLEDVIPFFGKIIKKKEEPIK